MNVVDSDVDMDELMAYADYLGIHTVKERDLLWIAREGLSAPVPEPYVQQTNPETQEIFFHNTKTGKSQWEHPLDEHFRNLVAQERQKLKDEKVRKQQNRRDLGPSRDAQRKELAALSFLHDDDDATSQSSLQSLKPMKLAINDDNDDYSDGVESISSHQGVIGLLKPLDSPSKSNPNSPIVPLSQKSIKLRQETPPIATSARKKLQMERSLSQESIKSSEFMQRRSSEEDSIMRASDIRERERNMSRLGAYSDHSVDAGSVESSQSQKQAQKQKQVTHEKEQELRRKNRQIKDLNHEIDALQRELDSTVGIVQQKTMEIRELKREMEILKSRQSNAISDTNDELNMLKDERNKFQEKNRTLSTRLEELQAFNDSQKSQLFGLNQTVTALNEDISNYETSLKEKKAELRSNEEEIEVMKNTIKRKEFTIKSLEEEVYEANVKIQKKNSSVNDIENEMDMIKDAHSKQVANLKQSHEEELSAIRQMYEKKISNFVKEVESSDENNSKLTKEVKEEKEKAFKYQSKTEALERTVVRLQNDIDALETRHTMLNDENQRFSTLVLELKGENANLHEKQQKLRGKVDQMSLMHNVDNLLNSTIKHNEEKGIEVVDEPKNRPMLTEHSDEEQFVSPINPRRSNVTTEARINIDADEKITNIARQMKEKVRSTSGVDNEVPDILRSDLKAESQRIRDARAFLKQNSRLLRRERDELNKAREIYRKKLRQMRATMDESQSSYLIGLKNEITKRTHEYNEQCDIHNFNKTWLTDRESNLTNIAEFLEQRFPQLDFDNDEVDDTITPFDAQNGLFFPDIDEVVSIDLGQPRKAKKNKYINEMVSNNDVIKNYLHNSTKRPSAYDTQPIATDQNSYMLNLPKNVSSYDNVFQRNLCSWALDRGKTAASLSHHAYILRQLSRDAKRL
ncbi:hypothetical protein PCE1_000419 [Barthelona sp. PCE]